VRAALHRDRHARQPDRRRASASNISLTSNCAFGVAGGGGGSSGQATFPDVTDVRNITALGAEADAKANGISPDPGEVEAGVAFAAGTVGHPAAVTVTHTVSIANWADISAASHFPYCAHRQAPRSPSSSRERKRDHAGSGCANQSGAGNEAAPQGEGGRRPGDRPRRRAHGPLQQPPGDPDHEVGRHDVGGLRLRAHRARVAAPALDAFLHGDTVVGITWLSQSFLQLVLLPIIIVGQNVISAYQDARAEADHETLTTLHTINVQQLQILHQQHAILELVKKDVEAQPATSAPASRATGASGGGNG
jgi:hypothetical protein